MAILNDTQINGNLNVTEDIQIGNVSVADKLNILSNLSVKTIIYEKTLTTNAYVSPYKYYGAFSIPENDITTYGEPISICATGSAGEPIPICFDTDRRGYRCNSYTNGSASVRIVYLKLPKA